MECPPFIRRPLAEESLSYGVPIVADGTSGNATVCVSTDGDITDIQIPTENTALPIEDIVAATNQAMPLAQETIGRMWWENGMSLRDAMNTFPQISEASDADLEILRQETISVPGKHHLNELFILGFPAYVNVRVNAVPEVLEIDVVDEAVAPETVLIDLYQKMRTAFRYALSLRHEALAKQNADPLEFDLKTYRWLHKYIQSYTESVIKFDDSSMFVLMPVGKNGERNMNATVQKLLADATSAGKRLDILLGLNQVDFPKTVAALRSEDVEVIDLYVNEDKSTGRSGNGVLMTCEDVFTNSELSGDPYVIGPASHRHRIFAIRQQKTPSNEGKNPLQGVFVRMLMDKMHMGSQGDARFPRDILLADVDSWFLQQPNDGRDIDDFDLATNGLQALCAEMSERDLHMIGARSHATQFDGSRGARIPSLHLPVNDIYRLLDASGGKETNIMVGGGTLGRFENVLPLLSIVCHRYPGSRTEDVHYTILANQAELNWAISDTCAVTNEVRQDTLDQPRRWFSGSAGLAQLYGRKAFKGVTNGRRIRQEYAGPQFADALKTYDELVSYGNSHPDDVKRGNAAWLVSTYC